MQSLRYFLRLIGTFISRFKIAILVSLPLGIILFFVFLVIKPAFLSVKHEKIGLTGRYTIETLPLFIQELISDGLTRVDEKGNINPGLAESWNTTDNGSTWVFKLKDKIFWQDKKKIESSGIKYSFSDVKIERPDEKTLVFKLNSPFTPFPYVVSRPIFKKGLLGTGEWKVTNVSMVGNFVQKIVLKDKNGDLKIYKFYPTEDIAKLAFKLGKVDFLQGIVNPKPLDKWESVKNQKVIDKQSLIVLFLNVDDKLLSEKDVRQALAYAINKKSFVRALSPISPNSWAYNPQVKAYNLDQERSKELLKGIAKELQENLSIKLTTSPILLSVAEKIVEDWKNVGIAASIQVTPSIPSDYQAFLAILQIPLDPDQYFLWHSTQSSSNLSHYRNPRIDKLLEDGRQQINIQERKKIYLDFQRFLIEDSPAIFLYHPDFYLISRK